MELAGRTALVVGLAKSGVAAAMLLTERGARVRATDAKAADALGDAPALLAAVGVELHLGGHPPAALDGVSLVVASPGVPESAPPLREARARGIETIGELELAWRCLPRAVRVVAITGSNGKSTTTTLAAHLLAAGGVDVWAGGNLGVPLSELSRRPDPPSVAVVEVSSFQLESAPTFAPFAAAWLNASRNHLDRHPSFEEYVAIKARIWRNAGPTTWTVFHRDDPAVSSHAARAGGRHLSFGRGEPPPGGGAGVVDSSVAVRLPGGATERYGLDRFPAPGAHNAENAAAAILLARVAGAEPSAVEPALASFRPLEHRLERCGEIAGISFFNDSKATTAEALARSLAVFERNVIVLAGGKDKGGAFAELAPVVRGRVKRLVTFGAARDRIADALAGTTDVVRTDDLPRAFARAVEAARAGDVVLFSPACASYDQFANFEERGAAFKRLVAQWRPD